MYFVSKFKITIYKNCFLYLLPNVLFEITVLKCTTENRKCVKAIFFVLVDIKGYFEVSVKIIPGVNGSIVKLPLRGCNSTE